ncbi:MAG TPA: hypothetical protein VKS99_11965, partial [Blastocatellia bacterium]|nr:hypothetical protein [Blastocatellia bacterium]
VICSLLIVVLINLPLRNYGQTDEMAAAFGVRGLGTALVVISGFYRLPIQETRAGFHPIIAVISKLTTKAVPNYRTPKATPI